MVDMTIESWRSSSSSSSFQTLSPCFSPSASISTAARSGPVSLRPGPPADWRPASVATRSAISLVFSAVFAMVRPWIIRAVRLGATGGRSPRSRAGCVRRARRPSPSIGRAPGPAPAPCRSSWRSGWAARVIGTSATARRRRRRRRRGSAAAAGCGLSGVRMRRTSGRTTNSTTTRPSSAHHGELDRPHDVVLGQLQERQASRSAPGSARRAPRRSAGSRPRSGRRASGRSRSRVRTSAAMRSSSSLVRAW